MSVLDPVTIGAYWFILAWMALQIFGLGFGGETEESVAHWAHIGGALAGAPLICVMRPFHLACLNAFLRPRQKQKYHYEFNRTEFRQPLIRGKAVTEAQTTFVLRASIAALATITNVTFAQAGSPSKCSGVLHHDQFGLHFGGARGEGEGICVIRKSNQDKILAVCRVGHYCEVTGTIEDCKDSGECAEIVSIKGIKNAR